jgi:hypothetical protein
MPRSQANDRTYPLGAGGTFTGTPESTAEHIAITVSILVPTECTLTIEQSYNKATWLITEQYAIPANTHKTVQQAVGLEYFRVILTNNGIKQTFCHMITTLSTSLTQNVNIRNLVSTRDSVDVGNFPAEQVVAGENSNFVFYPTAVNNTVSVYADGTQGTTVAGGWQYNNINNSGKINWYCYASPSPATDYKVSQLTSMYAVVNNLSTLGLAQAQNPWIKIYTRPNGVNDSAVWYKSGLFFGSNAHTDISGVKLLYTGEDPVSIHPEITGINRIQLLFNSALSDNKLLADVQNESIFLGTLQTTNNTSPANSFAFVMQEFGADWVKTPAVLPIKNGAVITSLVPTLYTTTINQGVSAVNFQSTAFEIGENSLVDVLLLATGITNGSVRLDYSADGATWFPDNTNTYAITTTDPHYVIKGIKTASRYIRVSTGGSSTFRATNLLMVFSSKRD